MPSSPRTNHVLLSVSNAFDIGIDAILPQVDPNDSQDKFDNEELLIMQLEDIDKLDDAAAELAISSINNRITQLALADEQAAGGPNILSLPSARSLISQVDNRPETEPLIPYLQDCLPPVGLLMETLDNPESIEKLSSVDRLVGIAAEAALNIPGTQVIMDNKSRYFGGIQLTPDIIKTLDEGRHLHPQLVYVLAHQIKLRLQEGPLSHESIGIKPKKPVIVSMDWRTITVDNVVRSLELANIVKSSAEDIWLSPILLDDSD